jgi:hypothetical protein
MQNNKMIKARAPVKPLPPHITPDDHFEEGMRLLARALRVWELKRRWPDAGNPPVSP